MGCISLFCCFRNLQPKVIAITALITNIICVAFLIWAIADLLWINKRQKVLYIISFVIYIVLLILVIIVLVLILIRQGGKNLTINNIGKLLCLLIIALCIIGFILLLIGYIFELKDYADIEKHVPGQYFPDHDWTAAILPGLLAFINSIITALCANVLYKIFNDDILTSVLAYQNAYPVNVNQNSITNIPNQDVIVTGNNAGIMPPIYQSGNNLNNK